MKLALAFGLSLAPVVALACPACARDANPWAVLLVAALVASPYAVAAVVFRAVRRGMGGGAP